MSDERLAIIETKQAECLKVRERIESQFSKQLENIENNVLSILDSIRGNGKAGIKERLTRVETLALISILGLLGKEGVQQVLPIIKELLG